jgi:hypothetical protein
VAVSGSAVDTVNITLPDVSHPLIDVRTGRIDPVWHRVLVDLTRQSNAVKALANAILTEVNTQHP